MMLKPLKQRHSPLLFKKKAISKAKLSACLEAARWAPSCFNNQPWHFLLIEGLTQIAKLNMAFPRGNHWALKAPLVGFIISGPTEDCIIEGNGNLEYYQYDCGMAMMNFTIQAENEGLKTHQMAGYSEKAVKKMFKIPKKKRVIVAFAVGYEEKLKDYKGDIHPKLLERIKTSKRIRKPLREIHSMNEYKTISA